MNEKKEQKYYVGIETGEFVEAVRISPNLFLARDPGFGEYDNFVISVLSLTEQYFANCVGNSVYNAQPCVILHGKGNPMIIESIPGVGPCRVISLVVNGNDYGLWVFQFAHELCHNIINRRKMDPADGLHGMQWFEETLCHLASICSLRVILSIGGNLFPQDVLKNIGSQLKQLLVPFPTACHKFLLEHEAELHDTARHDDLYFVVANAVAKLFFRNGNLWKILPLLGRTSELSSIEELLERVRPGVDSTFLSSFNDLSDLLTKDNNIYNISTSTK